MPYINLFTIFEWRMNNQLVEKVQELGLIPNDGDIKCPVQGCDGFMKIATRASVADGVTWLCRGRIRKNGVRCTKMLSIRYKSFFHQSNLPLWKVVAFSHLWVEKCPLNFIMKQLSISSSTAVNWASFCREVVFDAFVTKATKIGGDGKIVEIDGSKFGKRKYHRGHYVEGSWVFGGYERGTGRVFMVVVENRSAETLLDCIEKFIMPGTTIYSDCWRGYSGLSENEKYTHLTVNHSIHFKDPETEVHTNAIESSWRHAKASGPYANRKKAFLGGYLARYMFLKKVKEIDQDPLVIFFMLARDLYDPAEEIEIDCRTDDEDEDEAEDEL